MPAHLLEQRLVVAARHFDAGHAEAAAAQLVGDEAAATGDNSHARASPIADCSTSLGAALPGRKSRYIGRALDPREEYQRRLAARTAEVERLSRRDRLLANGRAAVFFGGVAWVALAPSWWTLAAALAFVVLVVAHDLALRARRGAERAATHYRRGLERLDGKWAGQGESGARFLEASHPYAADLDLFGRGSLFELVCTARTRAGEQTLADFLRAPAPPDVVRARQAAVDELRARVDLREDLDDKGEELRREVEKPDELPRWGERPRVLPSPSWPWRLGAYALGCGALALLSWWMEGGPAWPVALAVVTETLIYRAVRARLDEATAAILRAERELNVVAEVLARLEREPMTAPRLAELQGAIRGAAAHAIRNLGRLASRLVTQKNQFIAPFAWLSLWPVQVAFAVEDWRTRHGRDIARWLQAAGELEALAALGGYAFEHPADPFPTITDGARLEGTGLGHPLLAEAVRNDVALSREGTRVLLVSGSNMSGKSTLLRTVGANLVLALAGAPVRATALTLSPLSLGATLRIQDSLQEGASRFYAEITRLRQIVDLTGGPLPVLFLLDEILAGTNSHDRRIGAEGVVRGLVDRGAIGLCTTHDLALAEMQIDGAVNVHFEDHLEDGQLRFDYKMRPGVVRKSNALELMRAVGLKV
jgi:membrane protein implicated in regulation of membrane protease activity